MRRARTLERIRTDPQPAALKLFYRSHPVEFINDWIETYDPRRVDGSAHIPMILWPRQREYIEWLRERLATRSGGLVEKSRDMGVTYLSLAFSLWLWLFFPGMKIAFGSRKENLVDKIGDPDSIFEKARMMLRAIPRELRPAGYSEDADATFMKIVNRENGSAITGEAGDNIGRGGRSTIYFVDEAAYLERPMKVDAALSQNTDIRIDISSANGNGNPFYRKRMSGKVPVFTFLWRSDPRKDDAWYERMKRELDPVIVASEIDIDYNASTEDVCIPAMYVQSAIGLASSTKLSQDFRDRLRTGMRRCGFDVADEGADANAYVEVVGVAVDFIETWKDGTPNLSARKANERALANQVEVGRFDSIGVGAGAKGEFNELRGKGNSISWEPINTGSAPPPGRDDESGRPTSDRFLNLRAWLWWNMRRRFIRTYEHVNGIREYEPDQLIALPTQAECPQVMDLVAELSRPKATFSESGKIQIESKKTMKGASPNIADALMLGFVPPKLVNLRSHIVIGRVRR